MSLIFFIIIFFLFGVNQVDAQHVDTAEVKSEIDEIKTFEDQIQFIYDIYWNDQNHRGQQTNDSIDFRNLIAISHFINEFGYPKREDHGRTAAAPSLIWVHIKYHEIDRITFPIILRGFLSGEIREKDLRLNYLRGLYHRKYDDERYRTLPLKELFTICEVRQDSMISLKDVLEAKSKIDSFNRIPVTEENIWKAEDRTERYTLANGEVKERTVQGQKIRIFTKENGETYLVNDNFDRSGDPWELERFGDLRFRYKGQETNKFFAVDGDRLLFGDSMLVYKSYDKIVVNK